MNFGVDLLQNTGGWGGGRGCGQRNLVEISRRDVSSRYFHRWMHHSVFVHTLLPRCLRNGLEKMFEGVCQLFYVLYIHFLLFACVRVFCFCILFPLLQLKEKTPKARYVRTVTCLYGNEQYAYIRIPGWSKINSTPPPPYSPPSPPLIND